MKSLTFSGIGESDGRWASSWYWWERAAHCSGVSLEWAPVLKAWSGAFRARESHSSQLILCLSANPSSSARYAQESDWDMRLQQGKGLLKRQRGEERGGKEVRRKGVRKLKGTRERPGYKSLPRVVVPLTLWFWVLIPTIFWSFLVLEGIGTMTHLLNFLLKWGQVWVQRNGNLFLFRSTLTF